MKRLPIYLMVAATAVGLLLAVGCAPPAPPPAPTQAPAKPAEPSKAAAPAKAAEPTKAAAPAQPTAAPAAKVNWPEKGKTITFLVGFAAGGSFDLVARLMAPELEKILGVPVQILNKAGADQAVASTELAKAKPDGYTIMLQSQPTLALSYTDPDAKALFSRKDFAPIAVVEAHGISVYNRTDSPIKSVKELVDAAKASPKKLSVASSGVMGTGSIPVYLMEDLTGVKFSIVNTDSGAASVTTVLGGHTDFGTGTPSLVVDHVKNGALRILATTATERNRYLPDAPTFREQGYDVLGITYMGVSAPAGTPKEVIGVLQSAFKTIVGNEAVAKKMIDTYNEPYYQDDAGYNKIWDQMDLIAQKMVKMVKGK